MDLSKIFEYQGIELGEEATFDDYKKAFDERYITKENAVKDEGIRTHFMGEATSTHAREILRTAKENDIELTPDEKKLPIGDLSRLVLVKKSEKLDSKIKELESGSKKPSEELTALKEKYDSLSTRLNEELSAKQEVQSLLEKKENEFVTFQKDFKLDQAKESIFNGITYSDNADDLRKKGFMATIGEKYRFSLAEDESPIITDVEGNRIKDPNKHGSFLAPQDVLNNELEAAGLAKKVDADKFGGNQKREFKPSEKRVDGNGVVKPNYAKPSKTI